MKIIIVSPSLDTNQNVSGISSVTSFIIRNNPGIIYKHFTLGKKDDEKRNVFWFFGLLSTYLNWSWLMITSKKILVHFNLAFSRLSILRDTPLISLGRLFNHRMIIHIHGGSLLHESKLPFLITICTRYILGGHHPKLVLSLLEKESLQKRFNCNPVFILPNCVDITEAKAFVRARNIGDSLNLLFMSRISVDKGLEFIFKALSLLKQKKLKFKFFMAGKGPDEEEYIRKFNDILGDDFIFKGVVSGKGKSELLKECDLYLLPSLYEGLPMALLESMAFGLVPLTTNVGSIGHVVNHNENGIILEGNITERLVEAVTRLCVDKESLHYLAKNSQACIFENYNPEIYIKRLNEIYNV